MDVREKLIEILKQAPFEGKVLDEWWWEEKIKRIADHLISNGVTVQEWISVDDRLPERETGHILQPSNTLVSTKVSIFILLLKMARRLTKMNWLGRNMCGTSTIANTDMFQRTQLHTGCHFPSHRKEND